MTRRAQKHGFIPDSAELGRRRLVIETRRTGDWDCVEYPIREGDELIPTERWCHKVDRMITKGMGLAT
ncbi:hypothetical protein FB385_3127 [Paramicrobacterium agarici]|nr:hypothetical protein FB385_3127 [Microbacterium agarici]